MLNKTTWVASLLFACGIGVAYASDVHVDLSVSGEVAPGVYGRVNIGNAPPPVVYERPVVIVKQPRPVAVAPVYLHVPPGHAKNWGKHCRKYNACAQPVYFVRSAEFGDEHRGGKHKRHKHHRHDD